MLSHLETTKRYAYCALLTKDTYIPGLQTLARSFVTAKTAYPLIVLYNDLSDEAIEIVNREPGVIAKPIDKIIPAETAQTDYVLERFGEVWTKFRAWELTEYEKETALIHFCPYLLSNILHGNRFAYWTWTCYASVTSTTCSTT